METTSSPIRQLVVDLLAERYADVTFSDAIIESIEEKVAPAVRTQTESTVVDFVSDYFGSKKVNRKPRKPRQPKKVEDNSEISTPTETGAVVAPAEPISVEV